MVCIVHLYSRLQVYLPACYDPQVLASLYFFILQVSKRLEKTAQYFKTLGTLGFWSQLVCTTVSAGILSFSAVATGNATSPFTFFATSIGIVAAFISVFWAFGYIRLSQRLKRTANKPAKVLSFPRIYIALRYHLFALKLMIPCTH